MRRPLLGFGFVVVCSWASSACGGKVATDGSSGASSGSPAPTTSTITFPSPGNDLPPPPTTAGPTPSRPPPDDGTYTARARSGGLDHVEIFKADFANDRCTRVHLASPSEPSAFANIDTPATWAVVSADRRRGAKDCGSNESSGVTEPATDGKGSVSWPSTGGKVYPCTIDVNVGLVFSGGTTEILTRNDLRVIGGC